MPNLEDRIAELQRFYGLLPSPPRDPFQLFVWEVLSPHATPRKRDAAFSALKKIRALTPDGMWRAPQRKLEDAVALAGPYAELRLRALRIGVTAQDLQHQFLDDEDDDNGLERFITATRRQNFLVPPRRHRAFPLIELT